jgi:hypothetical protein
MIRREFLKLVGACASSWVVITTGCGGGGGNADSTGPKPSVVPVHSLLDENNIPLLTEDGDYLLMG